MIPPPARIPDRVTVARLVAATFALACGPGGCASAVIFAHSPDASTVDIPTPIDTGPPAVATFPGVTGASWRTYPSPTGYDLRAVWGSGASDVWAVGAAGTVIHWDGAAWSLVPSTTSGALDAVWGSSARDVWVAGWDSVDTALVLHGDGASFARDARVAGAYPVHGLWGSGAGNVWIAGGDASDGLYHFDGTTWTAVALDGQYAAFLGVAGSSASDVWFVEANQSVERFDGTMWHDQDTSFRALFTGGAWMVGPQDGFFTGAQGEVYRYREGWARFTTSGTETFHAVAGSSATDAWVAGASGAIAHWDGTRWSRGTATLTGQTLWGAWVDASDDGWMVGDSGTLLRLAP